MHGGDERARTADPLLAKQVLSQLSYIPGMRFELDRNQPLATHARCVSHRVRPEPRVVKQALKPEEWERQG